MCACVFIKLHITAQSGPVTLVIICHSHRVCVCVFIKLHITAQSGPVILVIICHFHCVCVCVCVCVFSSHSFWTSSSLDVPAGVTQEEAHTHRIFHPPSFCGAYLITRKYRKNCRRNEQFFVFHFCILVFP